ncbi:MAG: hypothetical protein KDA41_13170 [Planctomycetales bacterium]|nr:hypothetical protein [Planctomycetales bacterium]
MNVAFTCRGCSQELSWGQIRKLADGACDKCHSERWSVKATVSEGININWKDVAREAGESLVSGDLRTFQGRGVQQSDGGDISADTFYADQVQELIAAGSRLDTSRLFRLMNEAIEREGAEHRDAMLASGGRHCKKCDTLYAIDAQRAQEKPWQEAGYCSKLCWRTDAPTVEFSPLEATAEANPEQAAAAAPPPAQPYDVAAFNASVREGKFRAASNDARKRWDRRTAVGNVAFGLFMFAVGAAAWFWFNYLEQQEGGRIRTHVLIVLAYALLGKWGVFALFGGIGTFLTGKGLWGLLNSQRRE